MAVSLVGGCDFDPSQFRSMWDLVSVPDMSAAPGDAHPVADPQIDWRETPGAHIFKANLPGMKKEDVKVQVLEGKVLMISGERKEEELQKGDTWHYVERKSGSFLRQFRLPENSNVDKVNAQVVDGVLTVTIPKAEGRKPRVRQIEIA